MILPRRSLIGAAGALLARPGLVRAQSLYHRQPMLAGAQGVLRAPLGALSVNPGHPAAPGLVAAYVFGAQSGLADITGANLAFVPNQLTNQGWQLNTPGGLSLSGTQGTGPAGAASAGEPKALELNTLSLGVVAFLNGGSGNTANLLGLTKSAGSDWLMALGWTTGGTPVAFWATSTSASTFQLGSAATLGRMGALAISFASGVSCSLYLNGAQNATFTPTLGQVYDTTTRLECNSTQFDTTRQSGSPVAAAFVWNRALSNAELAAWTLDPYAVLAPVQLDDRVAQVSGLRSLPLIGVQ